MHIVLPFGILAGAYLGELFSRKPESIGRNRSFWTGDRSSLTGPKPSLRDKTLRKSPHFNSRNSGTHPDNFPGPVHLGKFLQEYGAEELMTYTQASPDIRELMEKIEGFNRRPETLRLYVVDPNKLYWPLPWYLRDYEKTGYSSKPPASSKYDAIIVPISYDMYREIPEEKYSSYNFTLRPGRDFTLYYKNKLEKNG